VSWSLHLTVKAVGVGRRGSPPRPSGFASAVGVGRTGCRWGERARAVKESSPPLVVREQEDVRAIAMVGPTIFVRLAFWY
jgi:hypothetical protein